MIIWGSKGRITRSGQRDTLPQACPECQNDLDLSDLKRWFTLYFIPVFPYSRIETFYYCRKCESSFKQEARNQLLQGKEGQKQLREESLKFFANTLVACMAYMASIDGEISPEEEVLISDTISEFPDVSDELKDMYTKIKKGTYGKDHVYNLLRKASEMLTAEAILILIASVAKMIKADGRIDLEEEKLMKSFLLICGLSEDLYSTVLEKAK